MIPHAMDFNLPIATDRLTVVAEAAGMDRRELTTQQASGAANEAVRRRVKNLGCPMRLRDGGAQESDFPLLAEAVINEGSLFENPRPIEAAADVVEILRKAWG